MMTAEEINNKILTIWQDKNQKDPRFDLRFPLLYPNNLFDNDIKVLIIGLNPSFSHVGVNRILTDVELDNKALSKQSEKWIEKLKNDEVNINQIEKIYKYNSKRHRDWKKDDAIIEKVALQKYDNYFKKIRILAKYVLGTNNNDNWAHIDLFFYRETDAKTVKKLIEDINHIDFFEKQFKLSIEVIQKLKPRMILVSNAYASNLFKQKYFYLNEKKAKEILNSEDRHQSLMEIDKGLNVEKILSALNEFINNEMNRGELNYYKNRRTIRFSLINS